MMEFYSTDISYKLISSFLVLGVALYFVLRILDRFVIPLLKNWRYARNLNLLWQRVQIILGVVFFVLYYYLFLRSNLIITFIFSLIVIGLGWSYWKNIFSGILIKFNQIYTKGEVISAEGIEGEIRTINYATTLIKNSQGEMVNVPNDLLRSSIIKHVNEGTNVKTHAFSVKMDHINTSKEMMQYVLSCPYISGNQNITIRRENDRYLITAILIDSSFIEDAESYFK